MKSYNNIDQRSDEWHHIRKGKITGTTLKSIMGSDRARSDAVYDIIAQRLTIGISSEEENAMDRGIRLEDDAIAAFEFETEKKVEKTGFSESDENPFIANSPDGWIGVDEGIEIKCPGGKNYVKIWLTDAVPDEYWWQVVQYFIVNEKLGCLYFVAYNPDIPVHPLHIIEISRKDIEEDIRSAKINQDEFLKEVDKILEDLIKLDI